MDHAFGTEEKTAICPQDTIHFRIFVREGATGAWVTTEIWQRVPGTCPSKDKISLTPFQKLNILVKMLDKEVEPPFDTLHIRSLEWGSRHLNKLIKITE